MDLLTHSHILVSFLSLTALEIILGIDNVVFIALLITHLPKAQQQKARFIGLCLALLLRIAMLFGIVWIVSLKQPLFHIMTVGLSGKDLMMLAGGLFLLYKATSSIHDEITEDIKAAYRTQKGTFLMTIVQIVVIDIIFSFDSVITAVGLTDHVFVIIAAMSIAMLIMLLSSGYVAHFIATHPTLKMLALTFVMMIGIFLVAEGLGFHIPKGYIYFGMTFSLAVEILNILVRRHRRGRRKTE